MCVFVSVSARVRLSMRQCVWECVCFSGCVSVSLSVSECVEVCVCACQLFVVVLWHSTLWSRGVMHGGGHQGGASP